MNIINQITESQQMQTDEKLQMIAFLYPRALVIGLTLLGLGVIIWYLLREDK